jgi:GntR family transcriptional regulator
MIRTKSQDTLPMYGKIASIVRNRIHSGQYEKGRRLPTEDDLVKEFGASKITIRNALSKLAEEGLILRFRGRGTFVSDKYSHKKKHTFLSLYDIVRSLEESVIKSVDICEMTVSETRIPREIMNFFHIGADDVVVRVQRVIWRDKVPIDFHENYLKPDLARHITKTGLYRKRSIIKLLKEKAGLVVKRGEMYYEAVALDGDIAPHLQCDTLSPVINARVFFWAESNAPVEVVNSYIVAEYFNVKIDLDLSRYDLI